MSDAVERILECAVIAVLRARESAGLVRAAEAILEGGIWVIEVSLTTPGALGIIPEVKNRFGSAVLFGAGTVLDAGSAEAAIQAGAEFIVAPTFDLETVKLCRRREIPVVPGAFTPSEVLTAWRAGADLVKLFPASLAGPAAVEAILGPLPHVKLVAVGGVNANSLGDFLRAGAVAVGVGSSLVSQELLDRGDFNEMKARAGQLREAADGSRL